MLLTIFASAQTLGVLTMAWSAVFLLATQLPQLHAADMATDGLPRGEILALHALGLDRLPWSLAVWLMGGLTVFAALASLVSGRIRWNLTDVLRGVALTGVVVAWLWTTSGAPPVTLEIAVGEPLAQVPAWMADGGGMGAAPGRWQAACRARAGSDALECAVQGAGLRHQIAVAPGVAAESQGAQFTWLSSAVAPLAKQFTLDWRATPNITQLFALTLHAGEPTSAPMLHARLQPQIVAEVGPLVLVSDGGPTPNLRLLASPDVLPNGRPTAQVRGATRIRLQVAASRPAWPLGAVFLALAGTFVAAWREKSRQDAEVG